MVKLILLFYLFNTSYHNKNLFKFQNFFKNPDLHYDKLEMYCLDQIYIFSNVNSEKCTHFQKLFINIILNTFPTSLDPLKYINKALDIKQN